MIADGIILALALALFLMYKDPMLIVFAVVLGGMATGVIALIHFARRRGGSQ